MTQIKKKYLTISKGQISPKLIERTDIDLLDKSGQEITNFQNTNFGSLKAIKGTYSLSKQLHTQNVYRSEMKIFPVLFNGFNYYLMFVSRYINLISLSGGLEASLDMGNDFDSSGLNITVAQYNDLVLVTTGGAYPLWQIKYSNSTLSCSEYTIKEQYISKQSPVQNDMTLSPSTNLIEIYLNTERRQVFDISKLRIQQTDGLGNTGSKATFSVNFVVDNNTVDNYLVCNIYRQGTTTTTTRGRIPNIFSGQILKANNNTQIILIEGISYEVSGDAIHIKTIQGRFLVGADNIDSSTGKMKQTDDWTFEVSPPLFSGGEIDNINSPWNIANYPTTITFYQNRLIIGGSLLNGSQVVFSKTGNYSDFSDSDGLNTDGFQSMIGSNKQEIIQHLVVKQGLQIFCKESEWQLDSPVVSRTNGFVKNSDIGSSLTKPIVSPNGSTLFVNKTGNNLVEYQYNYQSNSYDIPYLNVLTDILNGATISNLYLDKTEDGSYIYACLDNGDLIVMNYMQSHNIESFTRYHFDNISFISVSRDNINTKDVLCFFVTNDITHKVDVLMQDYNDTRPTYNKYINGLGNSIFTKTNNIIIFSEDSVLNGMSDINLYDSNGDYIATYPASNNSITLSNEDAEKDIKYIALNIHSKFVSNPLNYGMTTFDKYKNIAQLKIVVSEDSNPSFLTVNGKKGRKKDNFITFYRVARPSRKCQFTVENNIYPCEILSMEVDLEI